MNPHKVTSLDAVLYDWFADWNDGVGQGGPVHVDALAALRERLKARDANIAGLIRLAGDQSGQPSGYVDELVRQTGLEE